MNYDSKKESMVFEKLRKNNQLRNLHPTKLPIKDEGEIQTFPETQRLRNCCLEEMVQISCLEKENNKLSYTEGKKWLSLARRSETQAYIK